MAAISIRDWTRTGEPGADLDRLFGPLYRHLIDEEPVTELLEKLCMTLADELPAALVAIAKQRDGEVIVVEAAAPANSLWASLQSLPERCDGTVAGHGPAALALESGEPAWISTEEEGFRPWRKAATQENVTAAGAWPFRHGNESWLLEIFAGDAAFFQNGAIRRHVDRIVKELARFLEAVRRNHEQRVLANAIDQYGHAAFITNLSGEIEWTNQAFTKLYGYTPEEVHGNTPAMLHSGKQGTRYYQDLWAAIRGGRVWSGETVDRDKSGKDHTVRQTITPFGSEGRITHYLSTHEDITGLAAERELHEREVETDPNSGLMTSARFAAAIDAAIDEDQPFALALLSLSGYDNAVAGLAPELGEAISAEFGSRLREVVGPGCEAGVQQAGEYRLLLPQVKASPATLRRVVEALEEPFPMLGRSIGVKPRIALARYPTDAKTRDGLLRYADGELAEHRPLPRANRKLPAR